MELHASVIIPSVPSESPSSPSPSTSTTSSSPPRSPSPPRGPLPSSDSVSDLLSSLLPPSPSSTHPSSSPPTLRGVDAANNPHSTRLTPETDIVSLSGLGLKTLSLSPLALAPVPPIHTLSLAANALTTLDLAPLASLPTLTVLSLNSNVLRELDLTPLASLSNLERLWLHDNALTRLDLTPLSSTPRLRSLYLDDNQMHTETLDLAPLAACPLLRSLRLAGNDLAGSLDLTPLLAVPALAQLSTAPSVALVATGNSSLARVSPALRRLVLDISFRPPPGASGVPADVTAGKGIQPKNARSITPPVFTSSPSSSSLSSASGISSSVSRASRSSPTPAPPPAPKSTPVALLLVGFRRLARYAAEDALARVGPVAISAVDAASAAADATTALSRADPHVVVLHAPAPTVLRAVAAAAANCAGGGVPVVVLGPERYRTGNADLLAEVFAGGETRFFPDPPDPPAARTVYAVATERAREGVDMEMEEKRREKEEREKAMGVGDGSGGTSAAEPKRRRRPRGHELRAVGVSTTPPPGSPPRHSAGDTAVLVSATDPGLSRRKAITVEVGDSLSSSSSSSSDEEEGDVGGNALNLELVDKPPRSLWAEMSERLSMWRQPPGSRPSHANRFAGGGNRPGRIMELSSSLSVLPVSAQSPEMLHHHAKLRAERAAVEIAFHDLGGAAAQIDFPAISRACGMPKCAGGLLYRAVVAAATSVEATSPEPGVTAVGPRGDDIRGGIGRSADGKVMLNGSGVPSSDDTLVGERVGATLFLQYWDARLREYCPETRLFHVLTDSLRYEEEIHRRMCHRHHHAAQLGVSVRGDVDDADLGGCDTAELSRQLSEGSSSLSSGSSVGVDGPSSLTGPSTATGARAAPPDTGADGVIGLRGCDAAVGELVRAFMLGRSGRFGMFALVRLSEAVAIGTTLLLTALRGACGSRVGGRARPVGLREVICGQLSGAMIAAEAGIFEGVAANLSMDKMRNIKGNYASEAAPEAVVAADAMALHYSLGEEEVAHYNIQRNLLMPRGVRALLTAHCSGRCHMTLPEFALMHTAQSSLASAAGADYFFSAIDVDQDDYWSLADLQHFQSEKGRAMLSDGMALCGLYEIWACLCDMIGPSQKERGIARSEFAKLAPTDRKMVIQSLLFRDDSHATLNIRQTLILEGKSQAGVAGVQ